MLAEVSEDRAHRRAVRLACISLHLTAKARDRRATTSLRSLVVLNVQPSTLPRANLRAPRIDVPLKHFRSPRGDKFRLAIPRVCPAGKYPGTGLVLQGIGQKNSREHRSAGCGRQGPIGNEIERNVLLARRTA